MLGAADDATLRLTAIYVSNRIADFGEWRARRLCCVAAGDTFAAVVDEARLGKRSGAQRLILLFFSFF